MSLSLSEKATRVIWTTMGLVGLIAVSAIVGLLMTLSRINQVQDGLTRASSLLFPLERAILLVETDVVQVQQFLSDVSATRGKDGLDTGFEEAGAYAGKFHTDLAQAQQLANKLDMKDLQASLERIKDDFSSYYQTGVVMARAYVNTGPDGGNKLMPAFDEASERLRGHLAEGISIVAERVDTSKNDLAKSVIDARNTGLALIAAIAVLSVLVCGVLLLLRGKILEMISLFVRGKSVIDKAVQGNFFVRITRIDRDDEVGNFLHNMNDLLDMLEAFVKETSATMGAIARRKYYRRIREEGMAGDFLLSLRRVNAMVETMASHDQESGNFASERVVPTVKEVRSRSAELRETARKLIACADDSMGRAVSVVGASETASTHVQLVVSAAQELNTSIGDINRQIGDTDEIAREAVAEAANANKTVEGLNAAAQRIGEVIGLIQGIAAQTNLLALNATIEAARAGDAGKGFAVVASEVKNLANQTARATEDISGQVEEMRSVAQAAAAALTAIGERIEKINANVAAVTTSVREQEIATSEISSSVQEAAQGTSQVSSTIGEVSNTSRYTQEMARSVLEAADILAAGAEGLERDVSTYMSKIAS